jgi:hypothetical protein
MRVHVCMYIYIYIYMKYLQNTHNKQNVTATLQMSACIMLSCEQFHMTRRPNSTRTDSHITTPLRKR